jgi:predicted phage terminase large subunit-like protein
VPAIISLTKAHFMREMWRRTIAGPRPYSRDNISQSKPTTTLYSATMRAVVAASIDGALTGRGGDFIIIDDPLKAMDAHSDSKRERVDYLFTSSVLTRLDNKQTGAIVLVMQRLHPNDLAGMLQRSSDEWITLSFPAIAEREEEIQIGNNQYHLRRDGDVLHPELEPLGVLNEIRSQMPVEDFAAQYQQSPLPPGGTMIKRERVVRYDRLPDPTATCQVIQSWDTASKEGELNAYSVCITLLYQDKKYYVVDVLRDRFDFTALRERVIAHARAHRANTILIEDAGVGIALVSELKNVGLPVIAVNAKHSKQIRMFIQAQKFDNGVVLLPKQAPWLADFEAELFAFPHTLHDDQVDSISQALAYEPDTVDYGAFANGVEAFVSAMAFESLFRRG